MGYKRITARYTSYIVTAIIPKPNIRPKILCFTCNPYQMKNLVDDPEHAVIRNKLDSMLTKMLKNRNDQFLTGHEYIKLWDYTVNEWGTVDYQT